MIAPFQRPEGCEPVFSWDEVAQIERPDDECPPNPGTVVCGRASASGTTNEARLSGNEYNEVYWERGTKVAVVNGEPRTSLVTIPANGRIPPRTGAAMAEARAGAQDWLARVGLAAYAETRPGSLSSGMKQRVGLARALITDAPILLMDEPFAALDPLTRREMQQEVLRLKAELNKTVIMISHDPAEAAVLADRIAVLHEGRLAQVGALDELRAHPAGPEVAAFVAGFGDKNPATA